MTDTQDIPLRPLYPELLPYTSAFIDLPAVDETRSHRVYFECCGNANGIPVIFLHGGPGSACRPHHRRYFDPEKYHVILFDQRGCGKSEPLGQLAHNTTQDLIADMEVIRQQLAIPKWVVFGGSWGSTLALCYARAHPDTVISMVLRGIFLGRQQDIEWVYAAQGAAQLFPAQWQTLMHCLNDAQKEAPLTAFMAALHSDNTAQQLTSAYALYEWQSAIGQLEQHEQPTTIDEAQLIAHFKIQLHYALNHCFIAEVPILSHLEALKSLPISIVQGQYDLVCPTTEAYALHQALPHSELIMIHLAGHAGTEDKVVDALVTAMDKIALQFQHLIST